MLGERVTIGRFENWYVIIVNVVAKNKRTDYSFCVIFNFLFFSTLRIDLPGIEEIHAHIYTV